MVIALKLQTHRHKLYETILLTLLGVLMYVSQVIMSSLPNIELVTLLVILTTQKFGLKALYSIYIFVACEILTYGIHIWVINYLYIWAILCIVIYFLRVLNNAIVFGLIAAIYGLLFGTLCSIPYFFTGGISMGIAYIISGFGFDLIHCVANLVLTVVLYTPLKNALNKSIKPI